MGRSRKGGRIRPGRPCFALRAGATVDPPAALAEGRTPPGLLLSSCSPPALLLLSSCCRTVSHGEAHTRVSHMRAREGASRERMARRPPPRGRCRFTGATASSATARSLSVPSTKRCGARSFLVGLSRRWRRVSRERCRCRGRAVAARAFCFVCSGGYLGGSPKGEGRRGGVKSDAAAEGEKRGVREEGRPREPPLKKAS